MRVAATPAAPTALLSHVCPLCPQVRWLSGGEKARLALAKFMLTQGTVLVRGGSEGVCVCGGGPRGRGG